MNNGIITLPNSIGNPTLQAMCELLEEGQVVKMMFGGSSMLPLIQGDGDKIQLRPLADNEECIPLEIYLFVLDGHFIIHRLVRIEGADLVFQGDNNYHYEHVTRKDVLAKLTMLEKRDGTIVNVESPQFRADSLKVLRQKKVKQIVHNILDHLGRKRLSVLYFIALAILMWAPLNGLGVVLSNHILGLRMDHFLHASVYLVCPAMVAVWLDKRGWWSLVMAIAIGFVTEFGQSLLPYRGFDVNDLIANCTGNLLGWIAVLPILIRHKKNIAQK